MSELLRHLQATLADSYRVEREIGRGGMGVVLLAGELKHGRSVALKVLRPEFVGVIARERFLREIRLSAEFNHPCILPLLDSGIAPAGDGQPALPYFTMPYVEGETLRARLLRERQLPLEDAVAIARDVAAALDHAHGRGVVHRDIKPENIYLTGGHAVVADFGIARAVQEAVDPDALTSAGLVIGTVPYMSPEQAGGEPRLDGRSDIYALACVVYEMLGGEPPFTGPNPQAVLARHRLDPVPSLQTIRPGLPESVNRAVTRALAKSPADRYATAGEFAAALGDATPANGVASAPRSSPVRWRLVAGLGFVAALGIGAYALGVDVGWRRDGLDTAGTLDTTRYAVLEMAADSALRASLQPEILLQDALGRWQGVNLVDPFQVRDRLARQDTAGFREPDWQRVARSLGAGRYVRGSASRVGDSVRITAALYDATVEGSRSLLRSRAVRLPADLASADAAFASLADSLLLTGSRSRIGQAAGQSRSLPARQAFEDGSTAIYEWDLPRADSSFAAAVRFDPGYAQAHLWLALARLWTFPPSPPATWRPSAERAAAEQAELSPRDARIAEALLAQARGGDLVACQRWRELTGEYPNDFPVWYGLATCLRQDRLVVRDRRSPTGWRFRSSYNAAISAYERAYSLAPSLLRGLRAESYSNMVHMMLASGTDYRIGQGVPPDPAMFAAFPSWEGDTLVLHPLPMDPATGVPPNSDPTTREAIGHQRQRLHDLAVGWVLADPGSADALQALGVSLQLLGDRSALDTLVKARRLARSPGETIRVGTSEVWARVLFNAPAGGVDLEAARQLADSLLIYGTGEVPLEPALLASLAALTGRTELAARLGRAIGSVDRLETPPALVGIGISFLTYAALGGPRDSLAPLAQRVIRALETGVAKEDLATAQNMWLQLPILIGFPTYAFPEVTQLARSGSGLMAGYAAYLRADTSGALRAIQPAQSGASGGLPGSQTIDMVYGTAWLLAELGEQRAAVARVDEILSALPQTPPQLFLEVYQTGPLVRAMALRARLAAEAGDTVTARSWATAVITLWSDADAFLQPTVSQMRRLAQ